MQARCMQHTRYILPIATLLCKSKAYTPTSTPCTAYVQLCTPIPLATSSTTHSSMSHLEHTTGQNKATGGKLHGQLFEKIGSPHGPPAQPKAPWAGPKHACSQKRPFVAWPLQNKFKNVQPVSVHMQAASAPP